MQTFIATAIGLLLLAAFVFISRGPGRARACAWFIAVWGLACAAYVGYRVLGAGALLMDELGAHVAVVGFPVLLAMALHKRFSNPLA